MGQIFHPSTNTISKVSIFGGIFIIGGGLWLLILLARSQYATAVGFPIEQPVQFSHEHHVSGLGIDCRYCHNTVEKSSFAGMPSTETCMTCHSQIWTNAEMLEPVRLSWETGIPIAWNRVHDLADFVYFNHNIHVTAGIGCESCHGRVDQMPLMWKAESMTMGWCLRCHGDPAEYIRPRDEVFTFGYEPVEPQEVLGPRLVRDHHLDVERLLDCDACHN
ncbi:MAG: cytochrome c3 family protein [Chloroflexota bacterium]|nr:cytochrome c3 family protein [Chloroflexota bacterium]